MISGWPARVAQEVLRLWSQGAPTSNSRWPDIGTSCEAHAVPVSGSGGLHVLGFVRRHGVVNSSACHIFPANRRRMPCWRWGSTKTAAKHSPAHMTGTCVRSIRGTEDGRTASRPSTRRDTIGGYAARTTTLVWALRSQRSADRNT